LDYSNWSQLDKYRIHDSEQLKSRNRVTKGEVIRAVFVQQAVQTVVGYIAVGGDEMEVPSALANIYYIRKAVLVCAGIWFRGTSADQFLRSWGAPLVWALYWWAIPVVQFFFASFFLDTWQYFLHRLFHVNQFLYKHFHSIHHRLYVPYAFGALYNHPLEGFLLDSLGAVLAHAAALMSTRQAVLLFTFSTIKTVDDHCGFRLPFDPFQLLFGNNSDYHDIHHQVIGIKYNFSQPFFVHWDVLLGTRMTREDMQLKRQRGHDKKE